LTVRQARRRWRVPEQEVVSCNKLRGRVAHNKGRKATIEEIERNRQAQLSLPQLACPHCSKLIRNPGNMKQHIRTKHKEGK
jgi:hypothetical protein